MHLIGRIHTGFQWLNRFGHAGVIHRADAEVKIFIRLGAHGGGLRHARCWPTQHAPAGVVHTLLKMHWGLVPRTPTLLIFTRKTREFIGIVPATKSKVRIHFLHAEAVVLGLGRHLSIGGIFNQGPLQAVVAQGDVGMRPTDLAALTAAITIDSGMSKASINTCSPACKRVE